MSYEKYQECIEACNQCAVICEHCAVSCLDEENVKDLIHCIKTDLACADICRLASKLMAAGSEFADQFCALCADVCEVCGNECENHSHMSHCKECAQACKYCAQVCRKMAA